MALLIPALGEGGGGSTSPFAQQVLCAGSATQLFASSLGKVSPRPLLGCLLLVMLVLFLLLRPFSSLSHVLIYLRASSVPFIFIRFLFLLSLFHFSSPIRLVLFPSQLLLFSLPSFLIAPSPC